MKFYKLLAIMLALALTGCSLDANPSVPPETQPHDADSIIADPASDPTENPTEDPTVDITDDVPMVPPVIERPEPDDDDFVLVTDYIPDMIVDLRYATENNFTKQQIYDFHDAWLRYGTVKKLMAVQNELRQMGLYLKLWDGFRPPSAQFKLWQICPNPTYVSNPSNGFSSHSRGNTVDITLVNADGAELPMPTGFDDFSSLADRDYSDCSSKTAANALLLEDLMKEHGFRPYSGEWWHFTDTQSYAVDEAFKPKTPEWYYADCNEYISLRTKPSTSAPVITRIPAGEEFQVVALYEDFALVEYLGAQGYVLRAYTQPCEARP